VTAGQHVNLSAAGGPGAACDRPSGSRTRVPEGRAEPARVATKRRRSAALKPLIALCYRWEMVNAGHEQVGWSEDGTIIQITNPERLASHVLPTYFRRSQYSSWVRAPRPGARPHPVSPTPPARAAGARAQRLRLPQGWNRRVDAPQLSAGRAREAQACGAKKGKKTYIYTYIQYTTPTHSSLNNQAMRPKKQKN